MGKIAQKIPEEISQGAKIAILANFGEYCTRNLVEGSEGLADGFGGFAECLGGLMALEAWPIALVEGSRGLAKGSGTRLIAQKNLLWRTG